MTRHQLLILLDSPSEKGAKLWSDFISNNIISFTYSFVFVAASFLCPCTHNNNGSKPCLVFCAGSFVPRSKQITMLGRGRLLMLGRRGSSPGNGVWWQWRAWEWGGGDNGLSIIHNGVPFLNYILQGLILKDERNIYELNSKRKEFDTKLILWIYFPRLFKLGSGQQIVFYILAYSSYFDV